MKIKKLFILSLAAMPLIACTKPITDAQAYNVLRNINEHLYYAQKDKHQNAKIIEKSYKKFFQTRNDEDYVITTTENRNGKVDFDKFRMYSSTDYVRTETIANWDELYGDIVKEETDKDAETDTSKDPKPDTSTPAAEGDTPAPEEETPAEPEVKVPEKTVEKKEKNEGWIYVEKNNITMLFNDFISKEKYSITLPAENEEQAKDIFTQSVMVLDVLESTMDIIEDIFDALKQNNPNGNLQITKMKSNMEDGFSITYVDKYESDLFGSARRTHSFSINNYICDEAHLDIEGQKGEEHRESYISTAKFEIELPDATQFPAKQPEPIE